MPVCRRPPEPELTRLLYQYFIRGLLTALPLGLTVYLLYLFLTWSETLAKRAIQPFIGDIYVPGMGLLLGVVFIFALGFFVSRPGVGKLFLLIELPFTNLPVIKSIYSSLKDFANYFTPRRDQAALQTVVALRPPGQPIEIVGLVTRQSMDDAPPGLLEGDRVAVYLPMGYMIGGYTVFVPRDWVHPVEMTVEEAMRAALFAWMSPAPTEGPGDPLPPP